LEAAGLLPEAAAVQLLAKQNEKRKKKHETEKGRNLKKQRGNVAFVLPPGKVAISKMAIRKKKVSSKSVANQSAIRAKDSSASVSILIVTRVLMHAICVICCTKALMTGVLVTILRKMVPAHLQIVKVPLRT